MEARNYEIRKQLLKFDDVMNDQRKVVYEQRRDIMGAHDVAANIAWILFVVFLILFVVSLIFGGVRRPPV